ncbi:polysaccharide deacetylase family protein, partial [Treponema sp. R6D11]
MKKFFITFLIPLVLVGCTSRSAQVLSSGYSTNSQTISQGNIKMKYPQISGMADAAKQTKINDMIKNELWKYEVLETIEAYKGINDNVEKDMGIDLDYHIKLQTPELLSVFYTGTAYINKENVNNEICSITIDLKNAEKLDITDFLIVDKISAEKLLKSAKISGPSVDPNGKNEDIIAELKRKTPKTITDGFENREAYYNFYVTEDALFASLPISCASGDYVI